MSRLLVSARPLATALLGALLATSLFGACVGKQQVRDKRTELVAFMEPFSDEAKRCAPRELAEAEANLEFALYESEEGQTTRAWRHLRKAKQRARQAWERSRGDRCEADTDLDGIRDSLDKCPGDPEDFDGDRDEDGCPDYDRDGDGIDDETDRCPDEPEDKDGYQDADGCPDPDNDQDGIPDTVDKCPMDPEDRDGFEDIDGCPDPDNDKDGILDLVDKCPNDPEDMDGDEDTDGCPDLYKTIVVTDTRIELKQKVHFATGRDRILPDSFGLLDEVADVLIKRPDIMVRIEGHTDSRGSSRYNQRLSQKRAESVRAYLTRAGIEPTRLVATGFGEERPIDTNQSSDGRARNRRVEFHILR